MNKPCCKKCETDDSYKPMCMISSCPCHSLQKEEKNEPSLKPDFMDDDCDIEAIPTPPQPATWSTCCDNDPNCRFSRPEKEKKDEDSPASWEERFDDKFNFWTEEVNINLKAFFRSELQRVREEGRNKPIELTATEVLAGEKAKDEYIALVNYIKEEATLAERTRIVEKMGLWLTNGCDHDSHESQEEDEDCRHFEAKLAKRVKYFLASLTPPNSL